MKMMVSSLALRRGRGSSPSDVSVTGLDGQSLAPVLTVCMFTISCGKNLEHWLIITFSITDDLELHLPQHVCPVQVGVGRLLQLGPV